MGSDSLHTVLVGGIHTPLDALGGDVCFSAERRLRAARLLPHGAVSNVWRRSVDARHRDRVSFVWSVAVSGAFSQTDLERIASGSVPGISLLRKAVPSPVFGTHPLSAPPVVVGSGPAGLFCALLLAESGYQPVLLERGGSVRERAAAVSRFVRERVLDTETNIQFGAGGAGTFSDGKLVCRVNDPMTDYVLQTFVRFGAPEEIRLLARPHIGTDILSGVVDRMLAAVVEAGGTVLYHTRFESPVLRGNTVIGVRTSRGDLPAGALVLAVGHSARDTYRGMLSAGVALEPKPFSVGFRVEHLQSDIDRTLYGSFAGHPALGHAEYHLSCHTDTRGVYSFCMCPGGSVVAAASETGGVVVNGMSNHARDGRNANSALAVSVFREDYGNTPEGALAFQREIERAAYRAGGETYAAPICTVGDFLARRAGTAPSRVLPTYMDGTSDAYRLVSPDAYLPPFIADALRGAFPVFERQISGFSAPDALITGCETRTSAPLRILRTPDERTAIGYFNFYPTGEGAGYAGGITSAALDGIHTALALMRTYHP